MLGDADTALCLLLALRPSRIHLNRQKEGKLELQSGSPPQGRYRFRNPICSSKWKLLQYLCVLNTDKKLFCQAAKTVYTGVMRAWGVMLVEDHSSVKLLEWSLFLVRVG